MLLSLFTACCLLGNVDFSKIFGADYQKAVAFSIEQKAIFAQKAAQYEIPALELNSIIFPELIRHSNFQDFFETKALELAYVSKGATWTDFSIGRFQMKPSFIEQLEVSIAANENLKKQFAKLLVYQQKEASDIRAERIKRLKSLDWQLEYLCCFYVLVQDKFADEIKVQREEARIKFIATAYNFGFNKSFEEIQKWTQKACYPYGAKYPADQQYCYAEVAWDFYKKTK